MGNTVISDAIIFITLFKKVYHKCFNKPLEKIPAEPECKHLSDEIEEKTGLVIGWKSLKNYALAILEESDKQVNPSSATLDTLSRYLLEAAAITEVQRKDSNNSYIYWFKFREQYLEKQIKSGSFSKFSRKKVVLIISILFLSTLGWFIFQPTRHFEIKEFFQPVDKNSLLKRGWFLSAKNEQYWNRRGENPNHLTLFTLKGDSWRTKEHPPHVQNLLYRESPENNFSVEVHFSNFIPLENWQQSGLLFMEDTLFSSKNLRISVAYNDYFGGISQPGEIYIQVVASNGKDFSNPEEVLHFPLFKLDSISEKNIIHNNLKYSALKIEKKGNNFRFLCSSSSLDNFSFKEIGDYNFDMKPKYIGIFALKGFVDSTSIMPVLISYFRLAETY